MTKRQLLIRISSAGLIVCALILVALKASAVTQQTPRVVSRFPAPTDWVPVVADYVRTSPSGTVWGTYWRASDGSTRLQTGPTVGEPEVIDIKNVQVQRWYMVYPKADRNGTERPMQLIGPYRPPQFSAQSLLGYSTTTFEDRWLAIQRPHAGGRIDVIIPDLNYLVVDATLPGGTRTMLRNVRTDISLDPSLFLPDPGMRLEYDPEPGGIVQYRPHELPLTHPRP